MKWILSLACACFASSGFAADGLPLASDRLPLASDHPRHKHQAKAAEDCCETASYQWMACQDPNQVALYADGKQIGNYRYGKYSTPEMSFGDFYRLEGDDWSEKPLPYGTVPEGAPRPPKQGEGSCSAPYSPPSFLSLPPSAWVSPPAISSGGYWPGGTSGIRGGSGRGFFRGGRRGGGGGCSGGG